MIVSALLLPEPDALPLCGAGAAGWRYVDAVLEVVAARADVAHGGLLGAVHPGFDLARAPVVDDVDAIVYAEAARREGHAILEHVERATVVGLDTDLVDV